MLASTRRLLVADNYVRSGDWAATKPSPMMRPQAGMRGRKVGVYGMGEIGRKIAARVAAFETDVGYFSRSRHEVPYHYLPSLEALAEWCSVLMIAVRAGADTHHAVDAKILQKLGVDGYVVNIARGSVIDQAALITALEARTIAGAGPDADAIEGCMLKQVSSPYLPGRPKGPWGKWKRDPHLVVRLLLQEGGSSSVRRLSSVVVRALRRGARVGRRARACRHHRRRR